MFIFKSIKLKQEHNKPPTVNQISYLKIKQIYKTIEM